MMQDLVKPTHIATTKLSESQCFNYLITVLKKIESHFET